MTWKYIRTLKKRLRFTAVDGIARRTAEIERAVERHSEQLADAIEKVEQAQETLQALERSVHETMWAQVFQDTVSSSEWLHDTAFSPGRWAVGYPYLYALYRTLNETRPKCVLDLGLGQTTRMIAQYAAAHDDVQHVVVEHDQQWIDFFSRSFALPGSTELLKLDWDYATHKGAEGIRVYSGLSEALDDVRFDLISIDGPLGGDMTEYARIDVLDLVPERLADSFAIMMDDCERVGEQHALREVRAVLSEAGVDYRSGRYAGAKDVGLLCSTDLGFLCSM